MSSRVGMLTPGAETFFPDFAAYREKGNLELFDAFTRHLRHDENVVDFECAPPLNPTKPPEVIQIALRRAQHQFATPA